MSIPLPLLVQRGIIPRYFATCTACECPALLKLTDEITVDIAQADVNDAYMCTTCGATFPFLKAPAPYDEGNEEAIHRFEEEIFSEICTSEEWPSYLQRLVAYLEETGKDWL